jgi:hypothetical protein
LSGFISQFYLKQAKTRKKSQRGALGRPATWQKKTLARSGTTFIRPPRYVLAKKRSPAQISAAKKTI